MIFFRYFHGSWFESSNTLLLVRHTCTDGQRAYEYFERQNCRREITESQLPEGSNTCIRCATYHDSTQNKRKYSCFKAIRADGNVAKLNKKHPSRAGWKSIPSSGRSVTRHATSCSHDVILRQVVQASEQKTVAILVQ